MTGRIRLWLRSRADALFQQPVIVGVAVAAMICIGVAHAALLVYLRERAIQDSSRETGNLAYVLAEQTDRAFQSARLVTRSIVDHLEAAAPVTIADFERIGAGAEIQPLLRDKIAGLQHIDNVSITSARGKLVNRTRAGPIPDVDLSEREYLFTAQAAQKGELVITAPVPSATTGKWTIFLSQRVTGVTGDFLGVVSGVLELDTLEELYSKIRLGQDGTIIIARRDGVLLARYPRLETVLGASVRNGGGFAFLLDKGLNGVIQVPSPIDGRQRIVAAYSTQNFPVAMIVTSSLDDVLKEWRRERAVLIATGILACIIIALVALILAESSRDLANAQTALVRVQERQRAQEIERKQHEQLLHLAHHDALTGLPNRSLFREALVSRLQNLQGGSVAVLYLDLDRFKSVNDTLGHPIGDVLLTQVGKRLSKTLRQTDLLARLGGDEFAILQYVGGPEEAAALASRVVENLRRPFEIGDQAVAIGTSIGISLAPQDASEPDQIVKFADLALFAAKSSGRNSYEFFRPEMEQRAMSRVLLEQEMRAALAAKQFDIYYQPQVHLESGSLSGFEALLRWRHPTRGLISPPEFISLAEETGLIGPIGDWVIHKACAEAANWPEHVRIAVNVSAAQFKISDIPGVVREALRESGLAPERLEIEITESVMLDESPIYQLHALREAGVSISMDDFGTGYSSLSCLTLFPFDRLKIDQSFIRKIGDREDCSAIVRAATSLAEALGIQTTAEGIETPEMLHRAKLKGCTEGQGFLFGAPMPVTELKRYIDEKCTHASSHDGALRRAAAV